MSIKSQDVRNFVDGIIRHVKTEGDTGTVFPKVTTLLHKISKSDSKKNTAIVTSSAELTVEQKNSVRKVLEKKVNHALAIDYQTDKSLIAGLKVQLGDMVIDTSLNHQIDQMTGSLK